jgi:hypothetical protein
MSIETSTELKELFAALAKAQGEMKPAPKNSVNPAFARGASKGSKYADLADCMESIRPHLSKHGLSLSQMYGGPVVFTLLGHESGQWIRGQIAIPNFDQLSPQQIGSATTYLRRYSLGIVGLVTDEDDDGNAASRAGVTTVDPRGDEKDRSDYTTQDRDKYVSRFLDAFNLDGTEDDKARAVFAVHKEIAHKTDLYIAVGDELGSKLKAALHSYVAQVKKAQKAAA